MESKRKYNVYRVGTGYGCFARNYRRDFIGSTWAVSDKRACSQVRYRESQKYNFNLLEPLYDSLDMGYVTFSLEAVLASEDPYVEAV